MRFPRLRVRKMIFLVVYAALMGEVFMLGCAAPGGSVKTVPSRFPGFVWVAEADAVKIDELRSVEHVSIRTEGRPPVIWTLGPPATTFRETPLAPTKSLDDTYHLVPENLVK